MITVGLVTELHFIAKAFNQPIRATLKPASSERYLDIRVMPNGLIHFWYNNISIWEENIDDFFGVESCDTISRIISCIDNQDDSWSKKYPIPRA